MRLDQVISITEGTALTDDLELDREVRSGFASDLMSDVLRFDVAHGLLVTGLANPQVVRTAEMADVTAILLVRGKAAPAETKQLAQEVGIPIIGTELIMFETCGRLYSAGLPACGRQNGHS